MDWQQKLAALQCLGPVALKMRSPGNWYVEARAEIKQGSILAGAYGNGATPELAVLDHWRQFVDELPHGHYIVTDAYRTERRAVRWAGFMWQEVPEPHLATDGAP